MPCLAGCIALMAPRFLIVVLWLFTSWFKGLFATALWPVLGFIFLPTTLLWYTAVQHWWNGHWGFWQIVGVVIALMIDIGPSKTRRKPREEPREHPDLGREIT
ncbi:MAG TPA: hypothetical protein VGD27_16720 [Longimicrobiales bacterium]